MTTVAVVLAALLAAALVIWVARPFLVGTSGEQAVAETADVERLRRLEERDRALAALKELEFDHHTGKVSDADYATLIVTLRAEAAAALAALDVLRAGHEPTLAPVPGPIEAPEVRKEQPR